MVADDIDFGQAVHAVYADGGSAVEIAQTAGQTVAEYYKEWQGTYAAIFLFALQPGAFSAGFYSITPILLIGALVAGLGYFLNRLILHVLAAPSYVWLGAWAVAVFLCVQFPRSASEGFFWYNGGVFYVFFFALMLFALGYIMHGLFRTGSRKTVLLGRTLLLSALSVLLAGGNYPVALLYGVCLLGSILFSRWRGCPMTWPLIISFIIFVAGFAINVLAPGNQVRASYWEGLAPMRAIVSALFGVLPRMGGMFLRHRGIFLTILFLWLPFCIYVQRTPRFSYKWPWLPPLISWLILGVMFTPPFYATGSGGPDRLWNCVYFMFVLLLMANVYYLAGWFRQRYGSAYEWMCGRMLRLKRLAAPYIALCFVGILLVSGLGPDAGLERENATTVQAILELVDGTAKEHEEIWQRSILGDADWPRTAANLAETRSRLLAH